MVTSIQVSLDLINSLKARKVYPRETYEDVIRNLIEDSQRLSVQTRKELAAARAEAAAGKTHRMEDVRRDIAL